MCFTVQTSIYTPYRWEYKFESPHNSFGNIISILIYWFIRPSSEDRWKRNNKILCLLCEWSSKSIFCFTRGSSLMCLVWGLWVCVLCESMQREETELGSWVFKSLVKRECAVFITVTSATAATHTHNKRTQSNTIWVYTCASCVCAAAVILLSQKWKYNGLSLGTVPSLNRKKWIYKLAFDAIQLLKNSNLRNTFSPLFELSEHNHESPIQILGPQPNAAIWHS